MTNWEKIQGMSRPEEFASHFNEIELNCCGDSEQIYDCERDGEYIDGEFFTACEVCLLNWLKKDEW